jgi:hypothetical protein
MCLPSMLPLVQDEMVFFPTKNACVEELNILE